jgi:uridine monophosphate synthetase
MGFFTRLEARAHQVESIICVGLDPHPEDLPGYHVGEARDFCLRLIDATRDLVAAYKPNAAFFEAFGPPGVDVLKEVINAVPGEVPVILDAKRGDIASTASAYASAAFQALGAHAVTVNPYLGRDAITPFLKDPEHGVFLLCKTSNPGSADFQDLALAQGEGVAAASSVYERVAQMASQWNINDNLGLVVGATHPAALARVRALAPELWILAPGVGAQGADLDDALQAGLRQDGLGMLVSVSRSISRASEPRQKTVELRDAVNLRREMLRGRRSRGESQSQGFDRQLEVIADSLLDVGCVKFGQFRLKSGLQSPIYIDMRLLVSYPYLLDWVAGAYMPILHGLTFDRLGAIPYAALPIATAISLQGSWPLIYPRKESKDYGTGAEIEGFFRVGERVVVIDDLVTTGGSKFEAISRFTGAGLQVVDVVVLIDRQSGAAQALDESGFRLHAVFTLMELMDHWVRAKRVENRHVEAVREFLARG